MLCSGEGPCPSSELGLRVISLPQHPVAVCLSLCDVVPGFICALIIPVSSTTSKTRHRAADSLVTPSTAIATKACFRRARRLPEWHALLAFLFTTCLRLRRHFLRLLPKAESSARPSTADPLLLDSQLLHQAGIPSAYHPVVVKLPTVSNEDGSLCGTCQLATCCREGPCVALRDDSNVSLEVFRKLGNHEVISEVESAHASNILFHAHPFSS